MACPDKRSVIAMPQHQADIRLLGTLLRPSMAGLELYLSVCVFLCISVYFCVYNSGFLPSCTQRSKVSCPPTNYFAKAKSEFFFKIRPRTDGTLPTLATLDRKRLSFQGLFSSDIQESPHQASASQAQDKPKSHSGQSPPPCPVHCLTTHNSHPAPPIAQPSPIEPGPDCENETRPPTQRQPQSSNKTRPA